MIFIFIVQLLSLIAADVISKQDANKFLQSNSDVKVRNRRTYWEYIPGYREDDSYGPFIEYDRVRYERDQRYEEEREYEEGVQFDQLMEQKWEFEQIIEQIHYDLEAVWNRRMYQNSPYVR